MAERLALEEAFQRSPDGLEPAQRARLMFEALEALEAMVRNRLKEGIHFDAYSGLGCGGAVVAMGAGPFIARDLAPSWHWLVAAGVGLAALLGVYALAPLRPPEEEIALCLDQCRKEKWKIGRIIRVDRLWEELQRQERAASRSSPRAAATRPGS